MQVLSWLGRLLGGGPRLSVDAPDDPYSPGEAATARLTLAGLDQSVRLTGITVALRVYRAKDDAETTAATTTVGSGEFVEPGEERAWAATLELPTATPATDGGVEAVLEAVARFDDRGPLSAVAYPEVGTHEDVETLATRVESVGLHDGGVRTTIRPTERAATGPGGGDDLPEAILATDPVAVQARRFYPVAWRYEDAIDEILVIPWLEETGATLYVRARYAEGAATERDTEWATIAVEEIPDDGRPSMDELEERLAAAGADADSPEELLADLEDPAGDLPDELAALAENDADGDEDGADPIATAVDDLLESWAERATSPD